MRMAFNWYGIGRLKNMNYQLKNKYMANESYAVSWWGDVTTEGWGNIYTNTQSAFADHEVIPQPNP
jgi:hypothetical protein